MPLDFARYKPLLGDYLRLRGISFETRGNFRCFLHDDGETPLNVPDATEFFRLDYESSRAAITKAPEGVADVADVDPNRDNVRRAQHGTD